MNATAIIAIAAIANSKRRLISPCLAPSKACPTALGSPATMLEKIIIEIPFPIPLSVTSSPSHIKNTVPVIKEITATIWKVIPGFKANP